jgi:hypothetical protein
MKQTRLKAYGQIVGTLALLRQIGPTCEAESLRSLNALADLMIEHAERRRDLAHTEADARAMARDDDDVDTTPIQYGPPHGGW